MALVRPRVVLSYRRASAAGYALSLYDRFAKALGRKSVVMDVETLGPGDEFTVVLRDEIGRASVLLVVIDPGWIDAADVTGCQRLSKTDDPVRTELRIAHESAIRVVPVLVGGASMPPKERLPEELQWLANCHAQPLHDSHFDRDAQDLIRRLGWAPSALSRTVVPLLLLGAAGALWIAWPAQRPGSAQAVPDGGTHLNMTSEPSHTGADVAPRQKTPAAPLLPRLSPQRAVSQEACHISLVPRRGFWHPACECPGQPTRVGDRPLALSADEQPPASDLARALTLYKNAYHWSCDPT